MKRIILIFIAFWGLIITGKAQPSTLYFMTNVRQTIYTNPARMSDCSFSIAFPGLTIYNGLYTNSLKFANIFSYSQSKQRYYIDFDKIAQGLADKNNSIIQDTRLSLLNFGFRYRYWYFHFDYSLRSQGMLVYPRGIIDFLAYGNTGQYSTLDLSDFSLNYMLYTQKSITVAYQLLRNLKVGATIKLNHGFLNAKTNKFNFVAQFDTAYNDNYPVTLVGSYDFNVSYNPALIYAFLLTTHGYFKNILTDSIFNVLKAKNYGLSFDLGLVYQPIKQVEISASITNLGYIKWRENAKQLFANLDSVTFNGMDVFDTTKTKALLDTIKSQISPKRQDGPYVTGTYKTVNLGLSVKPLNYLSLGVNFHGTKYGNVWYNVYTLGAYLNPGYGWSFALNYSWYPNSRKNIGAGFAFNIFGAQLYFLMDNISLPNFGISYFTNRHTLPSENAATDWVKNTQVVNFMVGLNFNFGCRDRIDYGLLD